MCVFEGELEMFQRITKSVLVLAVVFPSLLYSQTQSSTQASRKFGPTLSYGDAPLTFEVNQGQAPGEIRFIARSTSTSVALTNERAIFTLAPKEEAAHNVSFQWLGALPSSKPAGQEELPGRTNYLVGDEHQWIRGIQNYARVRYASIYPGIDLVYYGNHRQLEYDFEVAAQADPSRIELLVQGADRVLPRSDGSLLVKTVAGDLNWQKPVAYQMKNGTRQEVAVHYRLNDDAMTVAFALGPYDHALPLTIDPVLAYAALIGPSEFPQYVAADSNGSAYLVTSTISPEYQTTPGSYMPKGQFSWQPPSLYTQPQHPLLAITKFSPDGSTLIYSTYLGGSEFVCSDPNASAPNGNHPGAITVDALGNAIVTGTTDDTNFPVTANAIQGTSKACTQDAIAAKLSADGSTLLYSTYLGSSGNDTGNAIAVDPSDNIYVGGLAQQTDFPTTKNLSSCTGYCSDIFVTKINADGTLGYSLLFGGLNSGMAMPNLNALAVDSEGNAYIAGWTGVDLPVVHALEPTRTTGNNNEGFVGEINPGGAAFKFLTYLGGSTFSTVNGIAVDSQGNIYAAGWTTDKNFPIMNAYQSQNNAYPSGSGFLTKYSPEGKSYIYSTYIGGSKNTIEVGVAVTPDGKPFLAGTTQASDYPVTADAFMAGNPGGRNISTFTEFDPSGTSLVYSTYLGGTAPNGASAQAESIAVTPDGNFAFEAGSNYNYQNNVEDFPVTPGAYDQPHNGDPSNNKGFGQISASFVVKFCMDCTSPANITILSPQNGSVLTSPVTFNAKAYDPEGVAAIQIYVVPGKVAYQTNSDTVNTALNIAPGNYGVVIQEWNNSGGYFKKTVNITVQNQPPTVVISSPAAGSTVSNPVHIVATAKVNGTGNIAHYRVYDSNNRAVYDVDGAALDAYVNLPQGFLPLTVVAWDSSGAAGSARENITVSGGSGGAQVVITSPVNFQSYTSPVNFNATATTGCQSGIYAMQIYSNPGVLAYTAYGSSVNTSIALSPGYYYGAVQAWDNCGATFRTNVQFQVQ
jgi:Beta-propeller repeat/Bacterial Ig domain